MSSSSSSSSSSEAKWLFDVFLSFRGEDVRRSFLADLHRCLLHRGINAYIDSEDLRPGDQISPALTKAIEESRIAVLVFSENYASSRWCLDELVKVMECKRLKGQLVLPVFYGVEPREVRGQRESYGKALARHEEKLGKDSETVEKWRQALIEAGNLSGWHYDHGDDTKFIENIVKEISTILARVPLSVAKYPVGLGCRVEKVMSLLSIGSDDVRMIGIWGTGGVGKTTIAKDVYNSIASQFDGCSFLANVRETSSGLGGLVDLQKTLLSQILWKENLVVLSVDGGANWIRDRLCCRKILLVLDDVDHGDQLNALAGECEWFGKGSRIIVTTRDKHVLTSHGVDLVYEVEPLDQVEGFELVSSHAFPRNQTKDIHKDLIYNILGYANGLPLAIVVLGLLLCGRSREEWESTLKKLAESPNKKINGILKISFDALEDNEKDIFLDIACFFKGMKRDYVTRVLDSCGLHTSIGIQILIERSLVTIEYDGIVQMHDLIQLMGQDIVKQECPDDPGKRSRLWCYDDVFEVLLQNTGTNAVKGIVLQLPRHEELHISPSAFMHMRRLKLLILLNAQSSGGPVCLPNDLRWLEWPGCPLSTPKFSAGPKKLVSMDVAKTHIKELKGNYKQFESLKSINLSNCQLVVCWPDLSCTPNLEELNLHECKNLECVHESVAYHVKLQMLDLSECSKLRRLSNVLQAKNLQFLNLNGCSQLQRFPDIPDKMEGLRKLYANETSIEELPASIENLVSLEEMELMDNKKLTILPSSIYRLQNILSLFLAGCSKLIKFPKEENSSDPHMKAGFPKLQHLNLDGCNLLEVEFLENYSCFPLLKLLSLSRNNFTILPTCGHVNNLYMLDVSYCQQLQEILEIPGQLCHLRAAGCLSLSKIPSNICQVDNIDLSSCHELIHNGFTINDLFKIEQFHPKTVCQVLLPGGEMPKWLLPNKEGCISFMASKDLYKKFLGLAFCVVLRAKEGKKWVSFELLACVNGKTRYNCYRSFSSMESDRVCFACHKPEALWLGDTPNDSNHFQFSIRALGDTIVKRCGFRLICKPLENDLEILLQDDQLLDPALLYEVWHEDSQTSTEEDSSCKLANMADFSLQVKDEAKESVVLIGNSYWESPHVAIEYIVGIDKQVEDMMELLDLEVSDVRIIGIWGMGGVGKTTLAKVIYKQISSRFDSCSFLADIEATTKQLGGVQFLQSKLMSDILKQEYEVDHVAKGVNFFKEVLRNMKVLIILDDVEVQSHLHEIVGEKLDWFGYGSRIIVTTSVMSILPKFISRGLALDYEINMMNNDQALELFLKHALRRNLPVPGFGEAAKDIINSVNGIPLLIEVIGSLLDRKLVEKLTAREEPLLQFGLCIQEILMVSYEKLSEVQREIFLDIACLPADVDCRIASFMWHNSHFLPSDVVHALHVKSLVKIGRNNELGMHRLLREFGQQIIQTEDHLDPGRRGRLCNLELAWNTRNMEGTEHLNFAAEDFKSMPNIRFLILDRANVDGKFDNVFPNLKWLQWQGCARDFKATNFHVEKLVILDLSWSKVTEDWGGWREIKMPQLKVLNLTGCADLLISPNLSSFPDLEILILEQCSQLMKLDPSIHHLKNLTSLNLRFCNELNMLPIELSHLKALKELLIDGTSVQEIPVSMGYMEQLEIFSASNCLQLSHLPDSLCDLTALSVLLLENAKITRIPDSAGMLVKLRDLSLKDCRWIERLPDSIQKLKRLEQLDITGTGISKLPNSITGLRWLKVLKMDSCFIRELPREIGNLANLEELHASYCRSLKGAIPNAIKSLDHLRILKLGHSSISGLPSEIVSLSCLQTLDLLRCNKIQALPELPSSLTCLRVSSERMKALPDLKLMVKLEEICVGDADPKELVCASTWKKPRPRLRDTLAVPVGLPKLKILELSHSKISNLSFRQGSLSCTHLKKLVLSGVNLQEVSVLPVSLSVLSIQRCFSLKGLPAVGNLRTLSEINLIQSAVEEIKGLEGLIALEVLNIAYCEIQNLNGLGQLIALRRLILSDCDSLDELPDISDLKMLTVLEVQRCKIHDIEGLKELTSLEVLHVSECEAEKTQQVQDALKRVMA